MAGVSTHKNNYFCKKRRMIMSRILIIDDQAPIRRVLREILEDEKYQVDDAGNGHEALQLMKEQEFDAVLCDIKMPEMDGLEVLEHIKEMSDVPVIMISGNSTIDDAVSSIKKGAFDFIMKPPDMNRLLITVRNALDKQNLSTENKALKKAVSKQNEMIGESGPMMEVREMIEKVAPTGARVLITGENGTGKELVAKQLHELSPRRYGPFIEVNCAAIPSELIESQLFGHEKGSFTSAIKQRKGDFELANGGTLFLDEIGDMSLAAQAKVLRALQENKIVRVGGEKEIPVDVRIIAATNKDLKKMIEENTFREDLYHRLSVIVIHVPPLRERKDDIPQLVENFVGSITQAMGKAIPHFTDEAMEELKQYQWTGNIRELHNIVERLVILCGSTITKNDVIHFGNPLK
jgi:DNA-binding NtrC family response regulator